MNVRGLRALAPIVSLGERQSDCVALAGLSLQVRMKVRGHRHQAALCL